MPLEQGAFLDIDGLGDSRVRDGSACVYDKYFHSALLDLDGTGFDAAGYSDDVGFDLDYAH